MAVPGKPRLLLGLSGGIACYKAAELTRLWIQDGIDVQVVMTQAACGFITPVTMQALSGKPVYTDMWDARVGNNMAHIDLSRDRDAIVIAPASADMLGKLAHGLADDLLSTLCVARECPLFVAPAMNRQMWDNAATQRNVAQLRTDGITVLGPASGDQACGEVGLGRMLEAGEIAEDVMVALAQPKRLHGKRILLTAGPTFEAIDAVRGITNRSSGKMGFAVARAAREAGAEVTIVSGPTALAPPRSCRVIRVESANQMFDAVRREVGQCDIFIGVAAVADYRPSRAAEHKIKKSDESLHIELVPNMDILSHVAGMPRAPFCVGFAAESQNLDQYAHDKRKRKRIPLIAANLVQEAIGADENELILFDDAGRHVLPRGSKLEQARQLIGRVADLLETAPAAR
ncbi:MAG: bifunctional phosphopantothenoylcysteine decarboxylase/phosphopantothenate--cysteine ligase CoaBC [Betaproteobacteria bacterium]|nr:MAG: bifunctional phosphopantothenoylcysteine decarboxylase/phosphopantothenate--cysteine ligase CoaBC [Betaproteobacteria bacterium]